MLLRSLNYNNLHKGPFKPWFAHIHKQWLCTPDLLRRC